MFRGFTSIVYKECIHVLRDPRTLFLMLMIPGLQLTIFGFAINLDVRDVATIVYDLDRSPASRALLDRFENTGSFAITEFASSDDALRAAIVAGRVRAGIKVPPDYGGKVVRGEPAEVQVLIDGSDSTVAMQMLNVSNAIALTTSMQLLRAATGERIAPPVETRPRILFNPDMKTANFMIPGLVAIIMQLVTMFLTTFSIVREKENGTLEQLMVTPVSRLGLMLGKISPYAVIGSVEVCMVLLIMRFLFQVPIAGSLLLLAGFSVVFLFTVLGLGLLISTVASNQIQALQFAVLIVLPSILLSGFVFPQESMPRIIYYVGQCVPVTYFIRILRGIILRDASFFDLWPNGAILLCMGTGIILVSALRFRKTLS